MKLYSLFDMKMNRFMAIVVSPNDESVLRALTESLPQMESIVRKYPEDFQLMCLGEFNEESGVIDPSAPPRFVASVRSLVQLEEV